MFEGAWCLQVNEDDSHRDGTSLHGEEADVDVVALKSTVLLLVVDEEFLLRVQLLVTVALFGNLLLLAHVDVQIRCDQVLLALRCFEQFLLYTGYLLPVSSVQVLIQRLTVAEFHYEFSW